MRHKFSRSSRCRTDYTSKSSCKSKPYQSIERWHILAFRTENGRLNARRMRGYRWEHRRNLLVEGMPVADLHPYDTMPDEEIVALARGGQEAAQEYLINKYRNFVRAKARSYFLIGADREDIIQEGMIGLYKAIRDFRSDKLSSFRAFAELCVTRQIITAIKTATRQKHIPLNSYVSLNKPIYDEDSDRTLLDIISGSKVTDPEELIISREEFGDIEMKMGEILSELEWKVLRSYLDGRSYQEIALDLDRHVKSIDNALQRVKRKLEKYLDDRQEMESQGSSVRLRQGIG